MWSSLGFGTKVCRRTPWLSPQFSGLSRIAPMLGFRVLLKTTTGRVLSLGVVQTFLVRIGLLSFVFAKSVIGWKSLVPQTSRIPRRF